MHLLVQISSKIWYKFLISIPIITFTRLSDVCFLLSFVNVHPFFPLIKTSKQIKNYNYIMVFFIIMGQTD